VFVNFSRLVFRAAPFGSTTAIVMPEGSIYGAFSRTRDLALCDFSFSKFETKATALTFGAGILYQFEFAALFLP
jgi:hypothetical protein